MAVSAGEFRFASLGIALAVVTVCAFLVGFALSLRGRAPEGVMLGVGTTLAAMLATAQPGRWPGPVGLYLATAIACWTVMPRARPIGARRRFLDCVALLRLGGLWMAVPVAVFAVTGRFVGLIGTVVVFVIVSAAALGRGRDLSVGYVAGLLVGLAALVASEYGRLAGAGAVLAFPHGLIALGGLGCAARIGLDPAFRPWQRLAALSVGAATLVAAESAGAFLAAAIGCVAYLVGRLRMPDSGRPGATRVTRAIGAGAPLAAIAGLWVATYLTNPRATLGVPHVVALGRVPVAGRVLDWWPYLAGSARWSWVDIVAIVAGGALIAWRVTALGVPVWVTVVGLTGVVGALLGPTVVPSPGWVLALGAELWVYCHGLRTDRNPVPSPRTPAPLQVDPGIS